MRIVPVDGTTDKYFKEDEPDVSSYDIYDLGADDSEIVEWLVFDKKSRRLGSVLILTVVVGADVKRPTI